jgi:hypothetical protein
LAATKRPTSCSRIGSEGSALQSSFNGEDFDGCGGWDMKQTLHILPFDATYETRRRDRRPRSGNLVP